MRRRPAYKYHLDRAGIGPLALGVRERVFELVEEWRWPTIGELETLDLDHLETTYALSEMANHVGPAWDAPYIPSDAEEDEAARRWGLALRLELQGRGQLLRGYTEVSDYDGAERILLHPSQLYTDDFGRPIPRSRMKKIVDEWCDFLEAGNTPIRYIEISTRAPKRLISSLRGQTQLRGLQIKWGDYDDISALALTPDLWLAELKGAPALTDLTPLRSARSLRVLRLDDTRRATDYSPLADLRSLEELELTSGFNSPGLNLPSISFLRGLTGLRRLVIGSRVLDEDYSPLLGLTNLEDLWVQRQKVMHPTYEELERAIPALR